MQFFGYGGQESVEPEAQGFDQTSIVVDSQRSQPTTPTLRKSVSELDEDGPKDRIRKIERRAAATQQRSLDKKIQALNGLAMNPRHRVQHTTDVSLNRGNGPSRGAFKSICNIPSS
jgi:hypothetical protein